MPVHRHESRRSTATKYSMVVNVHGISFNLSEYACGQTKRVRVFLVVDDGMPPRCRNGHHDPTK